MTIQLPTPKFHCTVFLGDVPTLTYATQGARIDSPATMDCALLRELVRSLGFGEGYTHSIQWGYGETLSEGANIFRKVISDFALVITKSEKRDNRWYADFSNPTAVLRGRWESFSDYND